MKLNTVIFNMRFNIYHSIGTKLYKPQKKHAYTIQTKYYKKLKYAGSLYK